MYDKIDIRLDEITVRRDQVTPEQFAKLKALADCADEYDYLEIYIDAVAVIKVDGDTACITEIEPRKGDTDKETQEILCRLAFNQFEEYIEDVLASEGYRVGLYP